MLFQGRPRLWFHVRIGRGRGMKWHFEVDEHIRTPARRRLVHGKAPVFAGWVIAAFQ